MKRWMIVVGAVVVALLVAVVVLLSVLISQNGKAAEQAEFDRIVAICEDTLGPLTTTNLDAHVECRERLLED